MDTVAVFFLRLLFICLTLTNTWRVDAMDETGAVSSGLNKVFYLALDGNVKAALKELESTELGSLTKEEKQKREEFLNRFATIQNMRSGSDLSLVERVHNVYLDYWDQVLLQKMDMETGGAFLYRRLAPIIEALGENTRNWNEKEYDRVSEFLIKELLKTGVHAKMGAVAPHLNFMAWKTESVRSFDVDLGSGEKKKIEVVMMSDFVSLGWAGYATLGKHHVGGWVEKGAVHCVASSYDLSSEQFRVSFLAHEARHLQDLASYPKLSNLDLEYRAKLNELALAEETLLELASHFYQEKRNDPKNPHSLASYILFEGLSSQLKLDITQESLSELKHDEIRKASADLLKRHTLKLQLFPSNRVETAF